MLEGACLCGAARWQFDGDPGSATICNCTACRRYGVLWIYDWVDERVRVEGPLKAFARGTGLTFEFCPTCGNIVCWRGGDLHPGGRRRMAVNVRLADPDSVANLPVKRLDGLDTFDPLPSDGRTVRDMWF